VIPGPKARLMRNVLVFPAVRLPVSMLKCHRPPVKVKATSGTMVSPDSFPLSIVPRMLPVVRGDWVKKMCSGRNGGRGNLGGKALVRDQLA
jgi:hypothetical protein